MIFLLAVFDIFLMHSLGFYSHYRFWLGLARFVINNGGANYA